MNCEVLSENNFENLVAQFHLLLYKPAIEALIAMIRKVDRGSGLGGRDLGYFRWRPVMTFAESRAAMSAVWV